MAGLNVMVNDTESPGATGLEGAVLSEKSEPETVTPPMVSAAVPVFVMLKRVDAVVPITAPLSVAAEPAVTTKLP